MKELLQYGEDFLHHCKISKGLSAKTLLAYNTDLQQFSKFLYEATEESNVGAITKDVLFKYLVHLSEKYKPKSQKRKIATLKTYFHFLEQEELLQHNPLRKLRIKIKELLVLPKFLTLSEVTRILQQADTARKRSGQRLGSEQHRTALRNQAVLEMLFATGVRVSELCNLKEDDVNLEQCTLKVHGKGDKQRIIHFGHEGTIKTIMRYAHQHNTAISQCGYFFVNSKGRQISPQTVRKLVHRLSSNANLNRIVTPHIFRHTFATLLMDEGVDIRYIQQFLGHSSIMTTQIYTHVSRKKQEELLLTKHPRGRI